MRNYFVERLRRLAPVFVGSPEGLPPMEPDQIEEFSREFIFSGTPAFRLIYYALILALQALCLLTRGKSVYSLTRDEAEDFIQSLNSSRIAAISAIPTLLGMPIYMAHYNRDDMQVPLGFQIFSLREEAAKREVKR